MHRVGDGVTKSTKSCSLPIRNLVSLAWIAERWSCSRQTCRRVLGRAGVCPVFLGGDARNGTLRFDLEDVVRVESRSQVLAEGKS